jgi:hypothetical protein
MAQMGDDEVQKEVDELKKQKDKLDAEKALIDARKALADSQKALDDAKNSSAQELADLEHKKALADAQKALVDSLRALDQAKADSAQQRADLENQTALANAQKALLDAQNQGVLAKYLGDVKAGPYSGTVTVKDKAGTEEALLLSARAVKEAATKVAEAVGAVAEKFHVFSAKGFPNFQRLLGFQFRKELIKQAFASAGIKEAEALAMEAVTGGLVSAGLSAFSDILGFFKTDYEIGNIDVQLDESLLLFSVAGCLARKEGRSTGKEVHLPLVYDPRSQNSSIKAVTNELAELVELRTQASSEVEELKKKVDATEKAAADQQNAANKDALVKIAADLKPQIEQLNGAITLYDAFANSLTTPDPSTGASPLALIAQEFAIDSALKTGGVVLLLRLENTGGGYLLKKNLLTALWAIPLHHMGGATVTYLLLDGKEGKILAGDVVPIYGGFIKTDALRKKLSESAD